MADAASKLTVKVKLHPAAMSPERDGPVVQQAPWSKTRISLALLVLIGASVAGFQFLQRPVAASVASTAADSPVEAVAATEVVADAGRSSAADMPQAEVLSASQETSQLTSQRASQSEQATGSDLQDAVSQTVAAATSASVDTENTQQPAQLQTAATSAQTAAKAEVSGTEQARIPATPVETPHQERSLPAEKPVFPAGFSRIVLTDQMNNLQPGKTVGQQIPFPRVSRLYLFTELKGYAGQVLRHRWYFRDQLHTEAVLTIEDSPWRTYSENWLLENQRGPWRVEIVDQTQKVIFQYSFTYQ